MNFKKTKKGIVFYTCGNYPIRSILFENLTHPNLLVATLIAEIYKRHYTSFEVKRSITLRHSEAIALAVVLEDTPGLEFLASEIKMLLKL